VTDTTTANGYGPDWCGPTHNVKLAGMVRGHKYAFVVYATATGAQSDWSNFAGASDSSNPTSSQFPYAGITNLWATVNPADGTVALTWDPYAGDGIQGGGQVLDYRIYRSNSTDAFGNPVYDWVGWVFNRTPLPATWVDQSPDVGIVTYKVVAT